MLETQREVIRWQDMSDIRSSIRSDDTHSRAEDNQERHDGNQTENLWQNQIACRVDTHDVECVNLLGYSHGAQLRSDVGPHLSGENQTHDAGRELEEHNLAGGVARYPSGHPWTLDVELHLDTDYRTDEERDEEDDTDGIDTQLLHFLDILFEEHAHSLRSRE